MAKEVRKIVWLLAVYIIIFWIGFRSGEIYNRIKNKVKIENVVIPVGMPEPRKFYIVETDRLGGISFADVDETDVRIKFFLNKNLKPLLKLRNLKIYTVRGERIY